MAEQGRRVTLFWGRIWLGPIALAATWRIRGWVTSSRLILIRVDGAVETG